MLLHRYNELGRAIVSDNFHLRIHCPSELYCHHDLQLTCHHCTQSEKHEDSNKFGFAGDGHNGFAHDRLSISMVRNFQTLYFSFSDQAFKMVSLIRTILVASTTLLVWKIDSRPRSGRYGLFRCPWLPCTINFINREFDGFLFIFSPSSALFSPLEITWILIMITDQLILSNWKVKYKNMITSSRINKEHY